MAYASASELTAQVCKLHDMGFQIHCHCNGDAGADLFLNTVELPKTPTLETITAIRSFAAKCSMMISSNGWQGWV